MDFADDIVLFENTLDRAQEQLTTTAKWARRVGLQVNIGKTEWTKNFKYLGSHIASTESKGQAWGDF